VGSLWGEGGGFKRCLKLVEGEVLIGRTSHFESNDWFSDSIFRKVRDGRSTSFWKDPWLGAIPLIICFPKLFQVSIQKEVKVIDMTVREISEWVWDLKWRGVFLNRNL